MKTKHKLKLVKGQRVKIISNSGGVTHYFDIGQIVKVEHFNKDSSPSVYCIDQECCGQFVSTEDLEIFND